MKEKVVDGMRSGNGIGKSISKKRGRNAEANEREDVLKATVLHVIMVLVELYVLSTRPSRSSVELFTLFKSWAARAA